MSTVSTRPLHFISWDGAAKEFGLVRTAPGGPEGGNLEALKALFGSLKAPLKVLGVIGTLRSGKSFLMNSLYYHPESPYARGTEGFALGDSVQPVTKGIWAWAKSLPGGGSLLLLDTEGLNDPKHSDPSYDVRVFAMSIALCNTLVYNMKGYADARAIDDLAAVAKLTQQFGFKQKDSSVSADDAARLFPRLEFLVRDFGLTMEDEDGDPITEQEWLEKHVLAQSTDVDPKSLNRDAIKSTIKKLFVKRNIKTLPPPVGDANLLKHMETTKEEDVVEAFRVGMRDFSERVLTEVEPRRVLLPDGKAGSMLLDGMGYLDWVDGVVTSMNSGKMCVETAVAAAARALNDRAFEAALEALKASLSGLALPVDEQAFAAARSAALDEANKILKEQCLVLVPDVSLTKEEKEGCADKDAKKRKLAEKQVAASQKAEQDLAASFRDKFADAAVDVFVRANTEKSTDHWKAVFGDVEAGLDKFANDECMCSGGARKFLDKCSTELGIQIVDDSAASGPAAANAGRVPSLPDVGLKAVRSKLYDELLERVLKLAKKVIDADKLIDEKEKEALKQKQDAEAARVASEEAAKRAAAAEADAKAKEADFAKSVQTMQENHEAALKASSEQHAAMVKQLRDEAAAAEARADEQMKQVLQDVAKREEKAQKQAAEMMDKQMTMMRESQEKQMAMQRESNQQMMAVMQKIADKPPPVVHVSSGGGGGGCCVM